jgi:hypothetical protein
MTGEPEREKIEADCYGYGDRWAAHGTSEYPRRRALIEEEDKVRGVGVR